MQPFSLGENSELLGTNVDFPGAAEKFVPGYLVASRLRF